MLGFDSSPFCFFLLKVEAHQLNDLIVVFISSTILVVAITALNRVRAIVAILLSTINYNHDQPAFLI